MTTETGIAGVLQKPTPVQWVDGKYVKAKQKIKKKKPRKCEADSRPGGSLKAQMGEQNEYK